MSSPHQVLEQTCIILHSVSDLHERL